ncbi:MAG: LLM class flavin-dependent oxidoreductase [Bacteroidota bacterium]
MEIGIFSFGETSPEGGHGPTPTAAERIQRLVGEAELAEKVGLDVFGVGEHHRSDYAVSAPAMVLAAVAARTERIRLTSTVTVLSSEDPVRVFQQFATLDALSNGRAEITAGRGSFIESFPLFGHDLNDYHTLFAEKLDLLLKLRENGPITWSGEHRAALVEQEVYPRPVQDPLPVWIAVGGTPASVVRAGALGLPLAIAIIGGMPERFVPLTDLYRRAAREAGFDPNTLPVSINSHGFLADTRQRAIDIAYPAFEQTMSKIGRERGWPPTTRQQFEAGTSLRGASVIGSPDDVIEKILFQHKLFGHQRFLLQLTVGTIAHDDVLNAIELLGTVVAPAVRKELAERTQVVVT